jgi:hypothetical protein
MGGGPIMLAHGNATARTVDDVRVVFEAMGVGTL